MATIQSKWIGVFGFILGFAMFPLLFGNYNVGQVFTSVQTIDADPGPDVFGTENDIIDVTVPVVITTAKTVPTVPTVVIDNNTIAITIDRRTIEHNKKKSQQRKERAKYGPAEFHNILANEALCTNLFRVGRIGDGGKWICGPQFIPNWDRKCVLYGFGINDDPSFEEEISEITNKACEIVAVDMKRNPTSVRRLERIGAHYVGTQLDSETTNTTTTVKDLMAKFNHTYIDVLKMDIEGSEFPLADDIFKIEICQMMIELHDFSGDDYGKFFQFLKKAAYAGFILVNHEVNFMTLKCVEITLLHEKCIDRFGGVLPLTKYLSLN